MFSTLIGEEPSTKVMNLMYRLKVHGWPSLLPWSIFCS